VPPQIKNFKLVSILSSARHAAILCDVSRLDSGLIVLIVAAQSVI
jgi:hypothetical protein